MSMSVDSLRISQEQYLFAVFFTLFASNSNALYDSSVFFSVLCCLTQPLVLNDCGVNRWRMFHVKTTMNVGKNTSKRIRKRRMTNSKVLQILLSTLDEPWRDHAWIIIVEPRNRYIVRSFLQARFRPPASSSLSAVATMLMNRIEWRHFYATIQAIIQISVSKMCLISWDAFKITTILDLIYSIWKQFEFRFRLIFAFMRIHLQNLQKLVGVYVPLEVNGIH